MRDPRSQPVTVTPWQKELLEAIIRRATSEHRTVRRAKIILAAAAGLKNRQIARRLEVHYEMVQIWCARWQSAQPRFASAAVATDPPSLADLIEEVLGDQARPGRPPVFSEQQLVDILAVACEDPQACGRPVSHWTPQELAAEVQQRGIVSSISVRQMGRFLKRAGSQTSSQPQLAEQ
jgi:putative transposase